MQKSVMATEARIHHYIPQAYLRGFGWNSGKNWYVHGLDLRKKSFFQPNTKNVCCERDFLRVDVKGHAPDVIEREMGKLEADARQAILDRQVARISWRGSDNRPQSNGFARRSISTAKRAMAGLP
ncbi:MAG: DUF4238 domain-containing protein [Rhodoferax sp.]|nr:DUF4238 domain-containing protein [Rhodoferax sp.]